MFSFDMSSHAPALRGEKARKIYGFMYLVFLLNTWNFHSTDVERNTMLTRHIKVIIADLIIFIFYDNIKFAPVS